MDEHTINEQPFHVGGKYGPGQEVFYSMHRIRLWKWYCMAKNTPFNMNTATSIYKQKKEILKDVCESLGLPTGGLNTLLIAKLDNYEFTEEQRRIIVL